MTLSQTRHSRIVGNPEYACVGMAIEMLETTDVLPHLIPLPLGQGLRVRA